MKNIVITVKKKTRNKWGIIPYLIRKRKNIYFICLCRIFFFLLHIYASFHSKPFVLFLQISASYSKLDLLMRVLNKPNSCQGFSMDARIEIRIMCLSITILFWFWNCPKPIFLFLYNSFSFIH